MSSFSTWPKKSSGLDVKSFFFESKFWTPLIVIDKAHRAWRHYDLKDRGNIRKMSTEVEMAKIRPDRGGVRVGALPAQVPGSLDSARQAEAQRDGTSQRASIPAPVQLQFQVRLKAIPLSFKNLHTRWWVHLPFLATLPRWVQPYLLISDFGLQRKDRNKMKQKQMNKQKKQKGRKWTRSKFLSQDSVTLSLDSHRLPAFFNGA